MSSRQHALETFLRQSAEGATSTVSVEVRSNLNYLNLRGDASGGNFASATSKVLRVDLPVTPNTFASEMSSVYWLGPDEWLVVSAGDERPTLPTLLDDAISGMHATLNDVTGGQICLRVSGKNVSAMLSKGCTLDLHPNVFKVGQCAQTGLAKASILLAKVDDAPTFDIFVRRSFAEYLALWLQRAGAEYGIHF
jgi:sarcosine oxidase subunit gamma